MNKLLVSGMIENQVRHLVWPYFSLIIIVHPTKHRVTRQGWQQTRHDVCSADLVLVDAFVSHGTLDWLPHSTAIVRNPSHNTVVHINHTRDVNTAQRRHLSAEHGAYNSHVHRYNKLVTDWQLTQAQRTL